MVYVLATAAIFVSWGVFRIERFARRQGEIAAAQAVLDAAENGMVKGFENEPGWGDKYFSTIYETGDDHRAIGPLAMQESEAARLVLKEFRFAQVFEVPVEPVAALATAAFGPDLVQKKTRFAANTALWRIRVFNQLVRIQTVFNTQHAAEVRSVFTSQEKRGELADASAMIALFLHGDGIGLAGDSRGWYGALKHELESNIEYLDRLKGFSWKRYFREQLFVGIDAVAFCALVVSIILRAT